MKAIKLASIPVTGRYGSLNHKAPNFWKEFFKLPKVDVAVATIRNNEKVILQSLIQQAVAYKAVADRFKKAPNTFHKICDRLGMTTEEFAAAAHLGRAECFKKDGILQNLPINTAARGRLGDIPASSILLGIRSGDIHPNATPDEITKWIATHSGSPSPFPKRASDEDGHNASISKRRHR